MKLNEQQLQKDLTGLFAMPVTISRNDLVDNAFHIRWYGGSVYFQVDKFKFSQKGQGFIELRHYILAGSKPVCISCISDKSGECIFSLFNSDEVLAEPFLQAFKKQSVFWTQVLDAIRSAMKNA